MPAPLIELLWWEGCPSWEQTLADLRAAVANAGLDPGSIVVREIGDDAAAKAALFVGSPTIRIDGVDVQPPGDDEPAGLTCRVYRLRDGRISPTPDPEDVRDALERVSSPRG
jgi:alkanesulfonate monooxygenase SsuD/methylene tetrahydromethanopterin reductase-like flavin-dependent oxidoreductase (luciferase family)